MKAVNGAISMIIKWLKNKLGMCEHTWVHGTNIMTVNGPIKALVCNKCLKIKYRTWPKHG